MSTKVQARAQAKATDKKHCIRCGKTDGRVQFANAGKLKCVGCDLKTADERREYHRLYHAARARALKRLIDSHDDEFRKYLSKETRGLVAPN